MTDRAKTRSAAWRISLLGTLAFACGTLVVFLALGRIVSHDIERRTDAWLNGEVEKLTNVTGETDAASLHARLADEVAELTRELPDRRHGHEDRKHAVFFLQAAADGSMLVWVGDGDGVGIAKDLHAATKPENTPFDFAVARAMAPFRVVKEAGHDGTQLYLGVSERDQHAMLWKLRWRFLLLWLLNVLIGFGIVFYITRRMLGDVTRITEAAAQIGDSDLSQRVPVSGRHDEAGQLAATLNRMLDRIEASILQLHTMTNSLAHDLRSPLTAIRAKLELSLTEGAHGCVESDEVVSAIDEVDRLTEILTKSLDVAEAKADALRLDRVAVDLDAALRVMMELYEPSFSERGLRVELRSSSPVEVFADASLLHRVLANLFDNTLKHLPAASRVVISLEQQEAMAELVLEDDGPGFAEEVQSRMFESGARRKDSTGRGLGLAFVDAVVMSHGGEIAAGSREGGGARLVIRLPLAMVAAAV